MAVRLPKAGEVAACSSWACGAGGRGGREGLQGGGVMVGLRLLKHRFPASTDSENVSIWSGAQVCEFNKRPAHSDANQV